MEGFTDDSGQELFNGVSPGTYHAVASAEGYEDTDSGSFEVDVRAMGQSQFVRLRPKTESSELKVTGGREGTVGNRAFEHLRVHQMSERLVVRIGILLVSAALYLRFLKRP